MKFMLSICFIAGFAAASLASADTENDLVNVDALEATESPIDSATEGGSVEVNDSTELYSASHDVEARNRRQDGISAILQMIFQFFIQVLTTTFGGVPKVLGSGMLDKLGSAVTCQQKPEASTAAPDLAPDADPTAPIDIVDDTMPAENTDEMKSYRRRQQQARLNAYSAGKKYKMASTKTSYNKIQTYKSVDMKAHCRHYLKSSDTNRRRRVVMRYFCKNTVRV